MTHLLERRAAKPKPVLNRTQDEQRELIVATERAARITQDETRKLLAEVRGLIPGDENIIAVNPADLQAILQKRLMSLHERQMKRIGDFLHKHTQDVQIRDAKRIMAAMSEKELRDLAWKTATRSGRGEMMKAALRQGAVGLSQTKAWLLKTAFKPKRITKDEWRIQMAMAAKRFSPEAAAAAAVAAMQAGTSPKDAKRNALAAIQGYVDWMEAVGAAIARAATVKATTDAVLEHDTPNTVGWQVLSMNDRRVRPAHKKRHGRKYFKKPKAGEYGLDDMPRPPFESPNDGSELAYGCRCRLRPLVKR